MQCVLSSETLKMTVRGTMVRSEVCNSWCFCPSLAVLSLTSQLDLGWSARIKLEPNDAYGVENPAGAFFMLARNFWYFQKPLVAAWNLNLVSMLGQSYPPIP